MTIERRDFASTVELRQDGDATRILGYAAVFNRYSHDLGGFVECIAPGAFGRVLGDAQNDVLALFNHDMDNLLATRAAGTLRLEEDDHGLRYEFDLDPTDPDHQRVIAKVRRGDLKGSSFGFRISVDGDSWATTEQDYPLRTITEISDLRDVGPVTTPAYPDTATIAPLALRSLSDLTGQPVEKLVEAGDQLRDFLIRMGEDHDDSASGDTVAEPTITKRLRPLNLHEWYSTYSKESS